MLRRDAVPQPLSLGAVRLPGAHWAPVLIGVLTLLAFARSFWALAPLLGAENPGGLSPLVPVLAVWLAAASIRRRERLGHKVRGQVEGAIDLPIAAALLGVAAWLVWNGADSHGWYFWATRLDLLAAGLFALGLGVLFFGFQSVIFHPLAVVGVLLIWPEPLVWLQTVIAEPLAGITAKYARPLALAIGTRLQPMGADPRVFVSAGPEQWRMIVADVCSGSSAGFAVLLSMAPAAVQTNIPWRKALPWMAIGFGLVVVSNIARVAFLLFSADRFGSSFAMGSVHPVAGAVLLGIVFFVLWVFMPRGEAFPQPAAAPTSLRITSRQAAIALTLTAIFAFGTARLSTFAPLPPVGAPGGTLATNLDYFRVPSGWLLETKSELPVQNLFGPTSKSYALSIRGENGERIFGQLITTPDRGKLRAYGLEACRVYHGGSVVGTRTVSLGNGAVATIIDTLDRRGRMDAERLSVLYWEAPFTLQGHQGQMHARVALFVTEADEHRLTGPVTQGIAPGGAEFDRADSALVQVAQAMTQELLARAAAGNGAKA